METLFAFDNRNFRDCQSAYRGVRNGEYYSGEYSIEPGSVIDVRADRKAIGSCSVIRMRARTRQFFRRSWTHIREDGTDVAVLWFIKRGSLSLAHAGGESLARAGDFMITRSLTPFAMECQLGSDGVHEVLHVVVPMHRLRRFVRQDVRTGFCVPAVGRKFAIAERILADLFEDPGELSGPAAEALMDGALSVLGDAVRELDHNEPRRRSLGDKRLADVLRYIELHVSDPQLTNAAVARGCGISTRYLSLLLKQHGKPLSDLVWAQRLQMAAEWLAMSRADEASISEIAYRVGFKSAAHFSRLFRREFQLSPRQYRCAMEQRAQQSPATLVRGSGQRRH